MDTAVIFNSMYASMSEARALIRLSDGSSDVACLCSKIEQSILPSEQGLYMTASIEVRFLVSAETASGSEFTPRLPVKIRRVGVDPKDAQEFRIKGRTVTGAVVTLMLGGVNE